MAAPQAKGGLGWAILAAALAIPGLLFFNWWTHLKAERQKAISQKARGRVPDGGVFTAPPPEAGKLVNPVAASTEAAAAVAAPAAVSPLPAPGAAAPVAGAVPGVATDAAAAVPAAPTPGVAPLAQAAGSEAAVSSAAAVATLPRDPTLSPMDIVRMQQEEMERQAAADAMKRALVEKNKPRVKPQVKIENYVDLQGIVANPDGENKAIVNDVVVGAGESFDARGHQVKVLRITAAGVTFLYNGKKFVKNVNRDE